MAFGYPVVFDDARQGRGFKPLSSISTRRDDPESFDEKLLQELIDETPNVLPVREFLPSTSVLYSLAREVPVDIGGSAGRIDNLLVTNDGYLVIVETKLYRNPESTRDVVTQTLQYGMAVCQMSMQELEARIRGSQTTALRSNERIHDAVLRMAASNQEEPAALADDFEETLEKHLRRGEILLLVVSDGIRIGIERVTQWLNEQGSSSPFKFGLVELKFYRIGEQRLAIPRTVLKTREVSRHVVVVDIRPTSEVSVAASVTDEFRQSTGGQVQESRSVKSGEPILTKASLMKKLAPEDQAVLSRLIELLESYGFDQGATSTYLLFGFIHPSDGGDFHPLVYAGTNGVWTQALKPLRDAMPDDELFEFHRAANKVAPFYRDDQIEKKGSTGSAVKYQQLKEAVPQFVSFLDQYRSRFKELLNSD